MIQTETPPEFSRPLELREVSRDGLQRVIGATGGECAALATRFGLVGIVELTADLGVRRLSERSVIAVQGRLKALVVQQCIVSLEPFECKVEQNVDERFSPADLSGTREVAAFGDEDFEEPVAGDALDLGEIVAQCLSLALDPYPRRTGATLEISEMSAEAAGSEGPFSVLARLKGGNG